MAIYPSKGKHVRIIKGKYAGKDGIIIWRRDYMVRVDSPSISFIVKINNVEVIDGCHR